jgi:hypothetical protein
MAESVDLQNTAQEVKLNITRILGHREMFCWHLNWHTLPRFICRGHEIRRSLICIAGIEMSRWGWEDGIWGVLLINSRIKFQRRITSPLSRPRFGKNEV